MGVVYVVEDGTGLSTANGYLSVADADQYNDNHKNDSTWGAPASNDAKERALILATQYIDSILYGKWLGERSNEDQALAWPRFGVIDADGYEYDSDELPTKLTDATAELAIASVVDGSLLADLSGSGDIKRERVKADVVESEVEYVSGSSQQKMYSMATQLLEGLFRSGNRLYRA